MKINIYKLAEKERKKMKIDNLPRYLEETLQYLSKNDTIKQALGGLFLTNSWTRDREWREFRGHISDWKINRYLGMY